MQTESEYLGYDKMEKKSSQSHLCPGGQCQLVCPSSPVFPCHIMLDKKCFLLLALFASGLSTPIKDTDGRVIADNCSVDPPELIGVNGTHLVNPQFLSNFSTCEYRIERPPGVCQVRLDFLRFETNQGIHAHTGSCHDDTLDFEGASNTKYMGPLCGDLTGQHVYLDYGIGNVISVFNHVHEVAEQVWDIQVTFVSCDSPDLPPTGCLQYYTEPSGVVKSFNYANQQQLNEEDYSVCIKSWPGLSKITWMTCGGFFDFFISGIPPVPSPGPGLPSLSNPLTGNNCTLDHVMIYGVNKFCGSAFDGPVTSFTQPFLLQVHFIDYELASPCAESGGEGADDSNTGFCLQYVTGP